MSSSIVSDGMTRAHVVRFQSASEAAEAERWMENTDNYKLIAESFAQTSR